MKKVLITCLVFCILAGSAFAQLTFSGEAYAGFQFEKVFDEDEQISLNHREEGAPTFNLVGNLRRENYGVKLDAIFQATTDPFTLKSIYGWVDFLDNSLRINMGYTIDPKWITSLDSDYERYFDDVNGFRIEYQTPLPGLSVGAAFRAMDRSGDPISFEDFGKRAIFGAHYVNPMFNAVGAYDLGGNTGFLLGFNYTGISALTSAGFQVRAIRLATWDSLLEWGEVEILQKIGYRVMRPLTVTFLAGQKIFGRDGWDMELLFAPGVSYRLLPNLMTSLTAELNFVNNVDRFRFPDDDKFMLMAVKPAIEFSLGGSAVFYAEYELGLGKYYSQSYNRFGFGIDIRAF